VIEYTKYTIENLERAFFAIQPAFPGLQVQIGSRGRSAGTGFLPGIYPNFMINAYEGVMDTNLWCPGRG